MDLRKPIPAERDGKRVFVLSPSTEGLYTWITSKGDDLSPTPPASGRGEGTDSTLTFTEPDTLEAELQFSEPIELHDGHICWDPADWGFADLFSVIARLPATTATVNGGGTGNCNKVEIAEGSGMYIIVPAAGDGGYDVDLDVAVPTPCGKDEAGYWHAHLWDESIHAGTCDGDESISCNLYDFQNDMYFIKNVNCGDPKGVFDVDVYKAEWMSSKWKLAFKVTRATAGAGKIGGWFMLFRGGAT